MDRTSVSGTEDPGSNPGGSTRLFFLGRKISVRSFCVRSWTFGASEMDEKGKWWELFSFSR